MTAVGIGKTFTLIAFDVAVQPFAAVTKTE